MADLNQGSTHTLSPFINKIANSVVDSCDSTNTLAKQLAEAGAPHGTWITARKQTAGRGRAGRSWESQSGNLSLSVVIRIAGPSLWSWIPVGTAVSLCRVLRDFFPGLDPKIKWPNDIWVDAKKLAGILCEGSVKGAGEGSYVIVGVGLNCQSAPLNLDPPAVDLLTLVGQQFIHNKSVKPDEIPGEIREAFIPALLAELANLQIKGPSRIREAYESWAAFPEGTLVEWGSPLEHGIVQGLGLVSELRVLNSKGNTVGLFAEEVRRVRKASCGFLA